MYRLCEFERRRFLQVDDLPVWVVSAEDLILSKLVWARESESALQLGDIRLLIRSIPGLDWSYIEKWALELDVQHSLAKVRST